MSAVLRGDVVVVGAFGGDHRVLLLARPVIVSWLVLASAWNIGVFGHNPVTQVGRDEANDVLA